MPDVFTPAKRSEVMSRIRSRGNKGTELALVALFRRHGISGWRRQIVLRFKMGEGAFQVRPDFVFRKERIAVFVGGCFWHGCPQHCRVPQGNREFWQRKFAANTARDRKVNRAVRAQGWRVLRIWEHELRKANETRCVGRVRLCLRRAVESDG